MLHLSLKFGFISLTKTCLCWKHENFQFLLDKLRFLHVVSTADTGQLFRTLCCDVEDKACAYGECSSCKEKKLPVLSDSDISCHSFYYKWTSQNQTRHSSTGKDIQVKLQNSLFPPRLKRWSTPLISYFLSSSNTCTEFDISKVSSGTWRTVLRITSAWYT